MQTRGYQLWETELGRHIQAVRRSCGMTQEEVGAAIGLDRVSVGYIEQGKRAPRLSTLYAMAELFGVEVKDLMDF